MRRIFAIFFVLALAFGQGPAMACVAGTSQDAADPGHAVHGQANDSCPHCDQDDSPPCGISVADACTDVEAVSAVPVESRGGLAPERESPPALPHMSSQLPSAPASGHLADHPDRSRSSATTALHLRHCRFDE